MSGQSRSGESGDGGQALVCGFGPPKGFRLLIVDPNQLTDRIFQLLEFFRERPIRTHIAALG